MSIRLAEVLSVDPETSTIITTAGDLSFDYLVIATGGKTNYFGNEDIMNNALSLKTTNEAIRIRNVLLENFEDILNSGEKADESMFNIIIVGAGPTGVELSGAFAEIKRDILPKDFPGIDYSRLQIILLEGGPHTLGTMSDLAWYVWMFLHLMLILSVRNKLIIFINWAWNYFTKNSSLRLILKVEGKNQNR